MQTVFVVTAIKGEYEDAEWWIASIFHTRKLANQFIRNIKQEMHQYEGDLNYFKSKYDKELRNIRWSTPEYAVTSYKVISG